MTDPRLQSTAEASVTSTTAEVQAKMEIKPAGPKWLGPAHRFVTGRLFAIIPLLILWEVAARMWVDSNLLPPFSVVVHTFWQGLVGSAGAEAYGGPKEVPTLLYQSGSSLVRVGAGFGIAVLIGVPLGFAMGYFKVIYTNLDPIISTLRPIPPIAWIPLAILWFGLGMKPTVFIIFVGTVFPIILNTQHGVRSASKRLIEFALVLGASRGEVLRKVIVYEAFPFVITGMRVGFGIGWMSVVAAEMIAAKSGLGYLVMTARWIFATDMVLAGMLMIGLIGFGGDLILRMVERHFMRWRAGMVMA